MTPNTFYAIIRTVYQAGMRALPFSTEEKKVRIRNICKDNNDTIGLTITLFCAHQGFPQSMLSELNSMSFMS